ncbi:MAG: ABC transporter ATP-binding protein [Actinomycetota bacterium]|nr:ABC transporter ATP-binding protein [Actinomycetota bacterium]
MAIIEIEGLKKEYRRLRGGVTVAVAGLDLVVPEGGVFGFLGPNGSGKTTTIRCLLDLVRPTAGRCRILGAEARCDLPSVIRRIGSIVETPALFPTFSGKLNLQLLGRINGIGATSVDDILERVGLADRADDVVKTYSLGMRQRLGIAAALLKDPELLILDEPANGLDPAGIKEIRDLIKRLANEGRTVFVSSHILSEVQQVCDRVAILTRGRCVAAGSVHEVLSQGRATGLFLRVERPDLALSALQTAGLDATRDGDALRVASPPSDAAFITKVLADQGLYLTELRPDEADLETVFLELTQDPVVEEVAV